MSREGLLVVAVVQLRGVNPFVRIDARRSRALRPGARGPIPVRVRVNDLPPDGALTNLMPAGDGTFYLYLNGPIRKVSRTRVGDRVRVALWYDGTYRGGPQHPPPESFLQGLAEDPRARGNWGRLSPSRQKEVLRYLARLKSDDARSRNVRRALRVLAGERERFLGREWVDGR